MWLRFIYVRVRCTILSVKPFSLVDAQPGGGGKRIPMARAPGLEATRVSSTVARRPPNIGHKMVNKVAAETLVFPYALLQSSQGLGGTFYRSEEHRTSTSHVHFKSKVKYTANGFRKRVPVLPCRLPESPLVPCKLHVHLRILPFSERASSALDRGYRPILPLRKSLLA